MCKGPEELSQQIILNIEKFDFAAVSSAFFKMSTTMGGSQDTVALNTSTTAPNIMKVAVDALSLRAIFFMESSAVQPPHLARILWALGRMGPRMWPDSVGQLLEGLIQNVERTAHEFTPRETAEVFQAFADMPWLAEKGAMLALFRQGAQTAPDFSPTLIAITLTGMHKLRVGEENAMLQAICRRGVSLSHLFTPHLIAMTLKALAQLKSTASWSPKPPLDACPSAACAARPPAAAARAEEEEDNVGAKRALPADLLVHTLCSRIVKITEEFEAGNTGSTLRSLSKLGAAQEERAVAALMAHVTATKQDFSPQAITDALVGLAGLKSGGGDGDGKDPGEWDNDGAIQAMIGEASAKAQRFNASQISDTLMALAEIGTDRDSPLVQRLHARIEECLEEFQARDIAVCLGALCQLEVEVNDHVLFGLSRRAEDVRASFGPQEIVELLWGIHQLRRTPDRGLVQVMSEQATMKAMAFDEEAIGEVLGVLAHVGEGKISAETLQALTLRAAVLSHKLTAPALVNILASLLLFSAESELPTEASIARALCCRAGQLIRDMTSEESATAIRALGVLCRHTGVVVDSTVLQGFAHRVEGQIGKLDARGVAEMLGAFADLGLNSNDIHLLPLATALVNRAVDLRERMDGAELSMTIATIERIGLEVDGQLVERYSDWLASDEGEEKGPGKHQRGFME